MVTISMKNEKKNEKKLGNSRIQFKAKGKIKCKKLLKVKKQKKGTRVVYTEGLYARSETYAVGGSDNAGFYAEAGVGKVREEFNDYEAEANGPKVFTAAEIGVLRAKGMVGAEVGSASFSASSVISELGLSVEAEAEAKGPNVSAGAEISAEGGRAVARAEVGSVSASTSYSIPICNSELSFSVEAEANGPNAFAGAEFGARGVSAMARAELASVSASAGPLRARIGLAVDTGVSVSARDGVALSFLGTGFRLGPNPSISLTGSEASCVIQ